MFIQKKKDYNSLWTYLKKNGLLPIFDDAEITELYKKIYFEKPRLLQALSEVETQLAQCEEVKTITANFDYTTLLNKYDIAYY